jgi:hypothetical protein
VLDIRRRDIVDRGFFSGGQGHQWIRTNWFRS